MLVSSGYVVLPGSSFPQSYFVETCFQPKAVLVWKAGGGAGTGYATAGNRSYLSYGFGTGSVSSQTYTIDGAAVFYHDTDYSVFGGGVSVDATISSFSATGFTLSMPGSSTGNFFWMAFGGTACQAYFGSFSLPPSGTTPDIVVTSPGFQPQFLLTFAQEDSEFIGASMGWGMASGSGTTSQVCLANSKYIFGEIYSRWENGYVGCAYNGTPGNNYRVQLKSFDTNGFTIRVVSNTNVGASVGIRYLALRDPTSTFKVGFGTQRTAPGTQAVTGIGFRPGGGIFIGGNHTGGNEATSASPQMAMGAASLLTHQGVSEMFTQSSANYQNTRMQSGKVLSTSALNSTTLADAAVYSWDPDGFTLNWTTADTTSRYYGYGVFSSDYPDPCSPLTVSLAELRFPQ